MLSTCVPPATPGVWSQSLEDTWSPGHPLTPAGAPHTCLKTLPPARCGGDEAPAPNPALPSDTVTPRQAAPKSGLELQECRAVSRGRRALRGRAATSRGGGEGREGRRQGAELRGALHREAVLGRPGGTDSGHSGEAASCSAHPGPWKPYHRGPPEVLRTPCPSPPAHVWTCLPGGVRHKAGVRSSCLPQWGPSAMSICPSSSDEVKGEESGTPLLPAWPTHPRGSLP